MARFLALAVAAFLLVPVLARADDETPVESTLDPAASPTSSDVVDTDPLELILRRLVNAKDSIIFSPNFLVDRDPFRTPTGTITLTGEGVRAYAAVGFTDQVTAGAAYSMVLNDDIENTPFSGRGPLTVFVSYELVHKGPLDVVTGGDVVIDLAGRDNAGALETHYFLRGGVTARVTVLKKAAIYTGSPLQGTPQAHELSLGLYSGGRSTLSLPLGIAVQAIPAVYAFVETNLADIYLYNRPKDAMGNAIGARVLFSDVTPMTFGAFYSLSRRIEVGASLQFADMAHPEYLLFTAAARLHTGP